MVSQSASVVNLLLIIPQSIPSGTFQLKQRLHVKSQYSWNKWYYKTPHGPIFHPNDTRKDRRGHHLGYSSASFKSDSRR